MTPRRKLHVCLLVLLLAVAFPVSSVGDCYRTVMSVPQRCSGEFIVALFADNKEGVSRECCILLACVREWACADVLRGFCLPPEADECPVS
ncbi:hypothetical protein D1007_59215 [Hordeum vulgare]|nr:hypothetical protein D1007_59215 [Hordeum vulgare]